MEKERLNWKPVMATAVVTGIVAVATGMILFSFQTRRPRLTYTLSETIPFQGDDETLAIHHVVIRNEGSRSVDDVDFHISVSPANVKEHRITGATVLDYTETLSEQSYRVHFTNLNPQESITVSILASSMEKIGMHPAVALRGKGVGGSESRQDGRKKSSWIYNPIIPAIFSAYSALFALVVLRKRRPSTFQILGRVVDSDTHSDDQNEIIAFLFNIHGLPEIAETYLKRNRKALYWSEADHIAAAAIQDSESATKEKRKQILIDLLSYARMAPLSEGIIHYNIARIAKHQGKESESAEHLEAARAVIPKLLTKRLSLDYIFRAAEAQQADGEATPKPAPHVDG